MAWPFLNRVFGRSAPQTGALLEGGSPRRPLSIGQSSPFDWSGSFAAGQATARARSQHFFVNDAWFGSGANAWPDNAVGPGITAASMAPDPDFRAAVAEAWNRWTGR